MNKSTGIFIFLVILVTFSTLDSTAQKLVILHDFIKEKSDYYKIRSNGDTVVLRKPGFNAKGNITLVITNYNPFYWVSTVEKMEEAKEEENLNKIFNPLGLLKQMGGGMIEQFVQMTQVGGSRGASRISRVYIQYKANYNELSKMVTTLNQYHAAVAKLTELKYNVADPTGNIKRKATEVFTGVTGVEPTETDSALSKSRELDARYDYLKYSLDTLYRTFRSNLYSTGEEMDDAEKELWLNIKAEMESYYQPRIAALELKQPPNPFGDEMGKITSLYKDISNTKFEFHYQVNANSNISSLRVMSTASPEVASSRDTIARFIAIKRKGGVRLTNSFGICFASASEKEYFVGKDSIVGSNRANLFTPLLSSFVHFYARNNNSLKWGGNVGVGIALSGEEKGVAFLGGLSAIFGRRDELIVSLGAVGTKVKQLSNGWKVGDRVSAPNNFSLPTQSYYRIGGFVGFTFNVSALTNKR